MKRRVGGLLVTAAVVASVPALIIAMNAAPSTPVAEGATEQRFSILCTPVHTADEDPSLVPVGTNPDHIHVFFGSQGIRSFPNGELPSAGMRGVPTSCEHKGDTASYWVPQFQRSNGEIVNPTQVLVYYRHSGSGPVVPHPRDFQMKSFDVEWGCKDSDNFANPPNCGSQKIRMRVIFRPVSVDGTPTPRIAMNVRYDTTNGTGGSVLGGTSGEHGNFMNTWDQPTYKHFVDTCLLASSVDAMSQAEWDRTCPKINGGTTGEADPTPTPSPTPEPSPEPPVVTAEEKLRRIEVCMTRSGKDAKLRCIRNVLAL
jgi:hypothetical protein